MPSIENITTIGGLTFQIESQDFYRLDKDWSNFHGQIISDRISFFSVSYFQRTNKYFIPTINGSFYESADGISWTAVENGTRPSSIGNFLRTQVSGFATNGNVLSCNFFLTTIYGYDGFSWAISYSNLIIRGVVWSGLQFIAIGRFTLTNDNTAFYTSLDGITWISRGDTGTNSGTWCITVGDNGECLAVGNQIGDAWYKTGDHGVTWYPMPAPANFKASLVVKLVNNPNWICMDPNKTTMAQYSYFSDSWSYNASAPSGKFNAGTSNYTITVIVGDSGKIVTTGSIPISGSVNWITRESGTTENLTGIYHHNNRFIVTGDNGVILTSEDGITWVVRRTVNLIPGIKNPTRLVAAYNYRNYIILQSPDAPNYTTFFSNNNGTTYTSVTLPKNAGVSTVLRFVVYGDNRFVGLGVTAFPAARGFFTLYSYDGITWSYGNYNSEYSDAPSLLIYAKDGPYKFVSGSWGSYAGFPQYKSIFVSTNGINWNQIYGPQIPMDRLTGGLYNGNTYIICGYTGIIYSTNGTTWNPVIVDAGSATRFFVGIAFNETIYVLVQRYDFEIRIYTSYNYLNWTLTHTELNVIPINVTFTNSQFIINTNTNRVVFSSNGQNWQTNESNIWPVSASISHVSGKYLFGDTFYLKSTAQSDGFTITPSVSGKSFWELESDGPLNLSTAGTWTIVPNNNFDASIKMWGAGGAGSLGGAGGAAVGTMTFTKNISYVLVVGAINGGGSGSYRPPSFGIFEANGFPGGGYSGIFVSSITQANARIMAGGGGGSSQTAGGAGGGTNGQSGEGDTGGVNVGGIGGPLTAGGGSGGGGGAGNGWYGGGGGGGGRAGGGGTQTQGGSSFLSLGVAGGGGGGSGYLHSSIRNGTLYTGDRQTPGNNTDTDRGTAGNQNTAGKIYLSF